MAALRPSLDLLGMHVHQMAKEKAEILTTQVYKITTMSHGFTNFTRRLGELYPYGCC